LRATNGIMSRVPSEVRMMHRWVCAFTALAAGCAFNLTAALAENRFALVIGNSAYRTVSALPNPANDAKAMTDLLRSAGFAVVAAPDLTQAEMRQVIGDFAAEAARRGPDAVVLVFYAGHGLQIDGENYLVPIDVNLTKETDVPLQAVRLADLMNVLSAVPSKTRIVMLDACRNNPFSEINKVMGRGLAIVDAPAGSIVSYSTSPGAEAEDGTGLDSPYTTAVLAVAKEPGLPIEQAFKRIRLSVNESTSGRQTPWESSSLTTDFAFFPGGSGARPAPIPPKPQAETVETWRRQLQGKPGRAAYDIVIGADTVEAYEAFVALYGAPPFGPRVRSLLERRREMVAWYTAVTLNTLAAYEAFMASYPGSDLAATAKRLMERARTRSLIASVNPVVPANFTPSAPACQCSTPPAQPQNTSPRRAKAAPPPPPPPPPQRRVNVAPPDIPVVIRDPRREPPPRRPPPEFHPGGPPPNAGPPPNLGPAISTGIAIGLGIAIGRGRGGGGMPPPRGGNTGPMHHPR
jgi:uncharacterized caspase-like protein